ncbi:MAG: DUF4145 domain-containing protein [Planctomycetota bacterium]|nr:DUF4145 domain-containing protein [Planctomycetota bacterium]
MNSVLKIKKGTFHCEETQESKNAHNHEAWDPDWIDYIYVCILECTDPSCREIVSSTGEGSIECEFEYDHNEMPHERHVEYYLPKYFVPHLKMFLCPADTPNKIREEIDSSFSLFFSDADAAANHVRAALEAMLSHFKIKRFELKGKKRRYLALHRRIELLPDRYKHLQDLFIAAKWLGNAGSHGGKRVSIDDVLDAYEIVEEILHCVFEKKATRVRRIAKRINKKKGPAKRVQTK